MNLEYLKEFCTVVQFQSITKAAEYLHFSQPSLSRHLKMLESSLNAEIIVRGNSKVFSLTPAGELLYEQGIEILKEVQNIEKRVQRVDVGFGGSLSISTGMMYSATACHLINEFAAQRKDIKIHYYEKEGGPALQNVIDGHSDISISYEHEIGIHNDEVDVFELEPDYFVALVSDVNPLSMRTNVTIRDLLPYQLICVREPEYGFLDNPVIGSVLEPFRENSTNALTFQSMILRTRVNDGFCILPYTSAIATSAGCHILEIDDLNVETTVNLIWKIDSDNPCIRSFIDFVQKSL